MRLIDADVAKNKYFDAMKEFLKAIPNADMSEEALSLLTGYSIMDNAPTIDAAPVRHGRWITNDDCGELECPICGGIQIEHGMFCTWCGARMDGGDNDAE